MTALLHVKDLRITLPGRLGPITVVDRISFEVQAGEVFGLAGERGTDRTLTALSMLGLLPPGAEVSGAAVLDGRDLCQVGKSDWLAIRGREIGMVFTDPTAALHPMHTIEQQLTEHVRHHFTFDRSQARQRAIDLLNMVRVPEPVAALRSYPHQFNDGMRQRIQIAVALACGPRFLIVDEPTAGLAMTVQAGILRLFDRLCRETGLGVLLITHDLGVLSAVTDRLTVMYAGRIVEAGPTSEVLRQPRHPYTRRLIDSLPHPEATDQALVPLPGTPPDPADRPSGCAFHPRCAFALEWCRNDVPELLLLDGRAIACPVDPLQPPQVEPIIPVLEPQEAELLMPAPAEPPAPLQPEPLTPSPALEPLGPPQSEPLTPSALEPLGAEKVELPLRSLPESRVPPGSAPLVPQAVEPITLLPGVKPSYRPEAEPSSPTDAGEPLPPQELESTTPSRGEPRVPSGVPLAPTPVGSRAPAAEGEPLAPPKVEAIRLPKEPPRPPNTEVSRPPRAEVPIPPTAAPVVSPKAEVPAAPKAEPVVPPRAKVPVPPKAAPGMPPRGERLVPPKDEPVVPPRSERLVPSKDEPVVPPKGSVVPPRDEPLVALGVELLVPHVVEPRVPPRIKLIGSRSIRAIRPPKVRVIRPPQGEPSVPPQGGPLAPLEVEVRAPPPVERPAPLPVERRTPPPADT